MFRSKNRALSVGPCSPTCLWKTREVYENWTHLSRSDLRNHAWVTRGTSVSWESSLHQPLFLSIKSDVLKFKCQNPLLVNVSTPLLKPLLMESEVVWWQTTGCNTGANSRASEANVTRLWALNSTFTSERVRGPLLARQNGLPWSHISINLISSTACFCSLVWLLSVFGWWPYFRSAECRQMQLTHCLKDWSIRTVLHWERIRVGRMCPSQNADDFRHWVHVQ